MICNNQSFQIPESFNFSQSSASRRTLPRNLSVSSFSSSSSHNLVVADKIAKKSQLAHGGLCLSRQHLAGVVHRESSVSQNCLVWAAPTFTLLHQLSQLQISLWPELNSCYDPPDWSPETVLQIWLSKIMSKTFLANMNFQIIQTTLKLTTDAWYSFSSDFVSQIFKIITLSRIKKGNLR